MVDAENVMKEFDLTDKTIDQIDQTLKVKRTKLNLFMANMEREGKETAKNDFFSLKATYSKLMGYQLPLTILLTEWIGVIETIREMSKQTAK